MTIKIEASKRLLAAEDGEKRAVKKWMGTNGRYAEVKLLVSVWMVLDTTTPDLRKVALAIHNNKECTLAELDECIKGMIKDVKTLIPGVTGDAKASLDSAKTDAKGETKED